MKKILVGTDGSDSAAEAVAHAARLAQAGGAELVVVHAYQNPQSAAGTPFGPQEPYPAADVGRSILEDAAKRHGGDASVRTVLREGDASDVVVEVAEEEGVDLIVVGNKGMTGAKRFLLGSVPNRVSHHAPCDVLIVHTT